MKTILTFCLFVFISGFCFGQTTSKFSSALIANAPCVDEGFEGLPNAPLTSPAWQSFLAIGPQTVGIFCTPAAAYTPNVSQTMVVNTPTSDMVMGAVPNSPFGGNKVLRLAGPNPIILTAKVSQTFSVTLSNFIYNYAYFGNIFFGGHQFCESAGMFIKFYDCSNNQIIALSKLIHNMITNPDAAYWAVDANLNNLSMYTPKWASFSVNLSGYIGSCVKVEIGACGCAVGGHIGYCYYDAECSDKFVKVNNNAVPNYTSCSSTATLSALGGFSSYLWQGPIGSGVNGSTLSTVTSSVPGTYSITVTTGTASILQTLNLSFAGNPLLSISGNTMLCSSQGPTTLQVTGNGISSYTWSNGSNSSSLTVFPLQNTVYSVSVTTSNGCINAATQQVAVNISPVIAINPLSTSICIGQNTIISASATGNNTYSWSTGSISSTISVTPAVTTVYSVIVTNSASCTSTATVQVLVKPIPNVNMSVHSATICSGQSIPLTISVSSVSANYAWSNGASGTLNVVSPTLTTVYTASANALGCISVNSSTVVVNPLPQLQPGASSTAICLGNSATLWADLAGTYNYTWSNGQTNNSTVVSPTTSTVYSATVTAINGCSQVCTHTLGILPLPFLQADASPDSIFCSGEVVNLKANSSQNVSYLWSNGPTTSVVPITALVGISFYTITVSDMNGCKKSAIVKILGLECTGIKQELRWDKTFEIFPNPSKEFFTITAKQALQGKIVNELGQLIRVFILNAENNFTIAVQGLSKGIYFVEADGKTIKMLVY